MTDRIKLKLLSTEEIALISEKCLDFLSTKGVKVDHVVALKKLEKAGAQVDYDNLRIKFPRDIIEAALRTVPHELTLAGREKYRDLPVPHPGGLFYSRPVLGGRTYLAPGPTGLRDTVLSDVAEWCQLVEVLDEISICACPSPTDVPKETTDIHVLKAALENTSKHISVQPYSLESIEYLFQLALASAGSANALRERPLITYHTSSLPPLQLNAMHLEGILNSCRYRVPMTLTYICIAGGTAPITGAGVVLLAGIMTLAMLVISQLIEPGTPVMAGPAATKLDMLSGRCLTGNVEAALASAATVQFIKDGFHIPVATFAFGTDSYLVDGQSMIDKTLMLLLVSQAGCDFASGAGQLDVCGTVSPIQLVLDNMLTSIAKRAALGVKVDEDTLSWRDILDIAPDGQFLDRIHTLQHCRDGLRPKLLSLPLRDAWITEGGKDLYARAEEEYEETRRKFQPQPIPEEVRKEMNQIVQRADERLAK